MAPSYINTSTKPFSPSRNSSASSAVSSTVSSPTSPDAPRRAATIAETASPSIGSGKFMNRIRSSRSRSPRPHASSVSSTTQPFPSPAMGVKRASTDTFRSTEAATPTVPRPRAQKRNSGTTMQVGRHSNDWLFGGFSFTDTVRDLLRHEEGRN